MVAFWHEWPAVSQMDAFLQGLADDIKGLMVAYKCPMSLDGAIKLSIWLELQVQARGRSGQPSPPSGKANDRNIAPLLLPPQPVPESALKPAPVPEPVLEHVPELEPVLDPAPEPVPKPVPAPVSAPEPAPTTMPVPTGLHET